MNTISAAAALVIAKGKIDTDSAYGLESTKGLISEEGGLEASIVSSISQRLEMNIIKYGGQLTAIRQGIYDLVEFKTTLVSIKEVKSLHKNIDSVLRDTFIASFGDEIIPTVDGLKTRLPVFTAELRNLFEDINIYSGKMIDELDTKISDFIGNGEVRESFMQLSANTTVARKFNIDVKTFIDRNINDSGTETNKIANIVGNNNEFKDSITNLYNINEMFSNKDLSKLEKKVEDIEARFEILIKVLKDDGEKMTKESLNTLIETIDILSSFLTNLSAIYYLHVRTMDVVRTISQLIK